jgi:hypothetical protein
MPVIAGPLDQQGLAKFTALALVSSPRMQALQQAGQPPSAPYCRVTALIDTGAAITVIDPAVCRALNLVPYWARSFLVPSSPTSVRGFAYKIDLWVFDQASGNFWPLAKLLGVVASPISHLGEDVLIGTDLLRHCTFVHNGTGGSCHLTY